MFVSAAIPPASYPALSAADAPAASTVGPKQGRVERDNKQRYDYFFIIRFETSVFLLFRQTRSGRSYDFPAPPSTGALAATLR
ncbi:MAG: hypothetical protein K2O55_04060, partial [Alistipes sp.]|nr:hypothetical protein [Alistipes sp.]